MKKNKLLSRLQSLLSNAKRHFRQDFAVISTLFLAVIFLLFSHLEFISNQYQKETSRVSNPAVRVSPSHGGASIDVRQSNPDATQGIGWLNRLLTSMYGSHQFADSIRIAAKSTCKISTNSASGTGFVVYSGKTAMWIMTCEHVVSGLTKKDSIKAIFGFGEQSSIAVYNCRIVDSNPSQDVAILVAAKDPSDDVPALSIRRNKPVSVGEPVMAFGCPLGVPNVCTFGRVGTRSRSCIVSGGQFIADITGVPGMSGSPILDENGAVVGMLEAVMFNRKAYKMGPVDLPEIYPLSFITDASVLSKYMDSVFVSNRPVNLKMRDEIYAFYI